MVAVIGGIGSTVSMFVTELAFMPGPLQDAPKIGVLSAYTLAAVTGAAVLHQACRACPTRRVRSGRGA